MKILALDGIAADGIAYLEEQGFSVDQGPPQKEEDLAKILPGYHGLLVRSGTKVTAGALVAAKQLLAIGRAGVGVDNIDITAASQRGIQVVNAPNGNTTAAAEHTMAMILALARHVPKACDQLKGGCWAKKGLQGVELAGKTLGIVGLGKIGSAVASRAKAFEMKVIGFDPYLPKERGAAAGVTMATLEEVFQQVDFLTFHLPLTQETRYLLGPKEFAYLRPGVRIINVARGGIVDEDALYQALVSGQVAGAALDVFEEEPVTKNPLFGLDNVVVTPHLGASTAEAQVRVAREVAEDVAGILKGELPRNPVNRPVERETLASAGGK